MFFFQKSRHICTLNTPVPRVEYTSVQDGLRLTTALVAQALDEATLHTGEFGRLVSPAYASNKKQALFPTILTLPRGTTGALRGVYETHHTEEFDTSTTWLLATVLVSLHGLKTVLKTSVRPLL